ncbi:MAG: hypothetical protein ABIW76_06115 [Fibrobacteria bacterium]
MFLALLEALLTFAGAHPYFRTEDPLVGFSGLQHLFVEAPAESGAFLHANPAKLMHFNSQFLPKKNPQAPIAFSPWAGLSLTDIPGAIRSAMPLAGLERLLDGTLYVCLERKASHPATGKVGRESLK